MLVVFFSMILLDKNFSINVFSLVLKISKNISKHIDFFGKFSKNMFCSQIVQVSGKL